MSSFTAVNTDSAPPADGSSSFTLKSKPGTDIYAAPAHGYVWTAPILYQKISAKSFHKARVTVSYDWRTVYDQGGLILAFPSPGNPNPDAGNAFTKEKHPLWVKAGIEINDGKPWASAVARENWADWSLSAPPAGIVEEGGEGGVKGSVKAIIEFERHRDALMVWVSGLEGQGKSMVREAQWVFLDGRGNGEFWLGVYCCSPDPKGERKGEPLEVKFEGFEVE